MGPQAVLFSSVLQRPFKVFILIFFFLCSETCTLKLLCTVYSCSASLAGRNREVCLLPAPQTRIHPWLLQSNMVHPALRASSFCSDTFKELKIGTHCHLMHCVPILQWFFCTLIAKMEHLNIYCRARLKADA